MSVDTAAAPVRAGGAALAERRFRRTLLALLGVGLLALLALMGTSFYLYAQGRADGAWVDHTYAAEGKISRLAELSERLDAARRGYIIDARDEYWSTYVLTRAALPAAIDDLAHHTIDNPVQRANIARLRELIAAKFVQCDKTIVAAHEGRREEARQAFLHQQNEFVLVRTRALYAAMQAEERRLLEIRTRRERNSATVLLAVTSGVALLVIALAAGAVALVARYAAELRRIQENLQQLNEGLEDRVRERTAELSRANEEIQRFAYIVSHDLRSPLVNVMGFTSELEAAAGSLGKLLARADAEAPGLVDREARGFITDEIPEAIGFIRSSTRKMDRLINAILKLSREGRRTLNPEPLAMDALAQGVADSLRQLAEARGAVIVVDEPLPELVNDRVAIEQLVSNLTENAVKYLSAERPGRIVIRGHATGARAVIEVADNGRGIDARDHERIFELFRRSGQQDQVGEGIGLAHVRALVYRLGGHITVDSELGRGSTFRVDLPRRLEREIPQAA